MFSIFEVLEMRGRLKRIQKQGLTAVFYFSDGGMTIAKVNSVGLTTVTLDIVADEDEETWLADYIFPISLINYVNINSVDRARTKFMFQSGETCEDCENEVREEADED